MLNNNEKSVEEIINDDETPAWKRLDTVMRSWITDGLQKQKTESANESD
jgi:hypothetical protein